MAEQVIDLLTEQYALTKRMANWAVNTWYYILNLDVINNSPGKQKCRLLRNIRVKIAEENNIEFVPLECNHFGECMGTCYLCDSEVACLN